MTINMSELEAFFNTYLSTIEATDDTRHQDQQHLEMEDIQTSLRRELETPLPSFEEPAMSTALFGKIFKSIKKRVLKAKNKKAEKKRQKMKNQYDDDDDTTNTSRTIAHDTDGKELTESEAYTLFLESDEYRDQTLTMGARMVAWVNNNFDNDGDDNELTTSQLHATAVYDLLTEDSRRALMLEYMQQPVVEENGPTTDGLLRWFSKRLDSADKKRKAKKIEREKMEIARLTHRDALRKEAADGADEQQSTAHYHTASAGYEALTMNVRRALMSDFEDETGTKGKDANNLVQWLSTRLQSNSGVSVTNHARPSSSSSSSSYYTNTSRNTTIDNDRYLTMATRFYNVMTESSRQALADEYSSQLVVDSFTTDGLLRWFSKRLDTMDKKRKKKKIENEKARLAVLNHRETLRQQQRQLQQETDGATTEAPRNTEITTARKRKMVTFSTPSIVANGQSKFNKTMTRVGAPLTTSPTTTSSPDRAVPTSNPRPNTATATKKKTAILSTATVHPDVETAGEATQKLVNRMQSFHADIANATSPDDTVMKMKSALQLPGTDNKKSGNRDSGDILQLGSTLVSHFVPPVNEGKKKHNDVKSSTMENSGIATATFHQDLTTSALSPIIQTTIEKLVDPYRPLQPLTRQTTSFPYATNDILMRTLADSKLLQNPNMELFKDIPFVEHAFPIPMTKFTLQVNKSTNGKQQQQRTPFVFYSRKNSKAFHMGKYLLYVLPVGYNQLSEVLYKSHLFPDNNNNNGNIKMSLSVDKPLEFIERSGELASFVLSPKSVAPLTEATLWLSSMDKRTQHIPMTVIMRFNNVKIPEKANLAGLFIMIPIKHVSKTVSKGTLTTSEKRLVSSILKQVATSGSDAARDLPNITDFNVHAESRQYDTYIPSIAMAAAFHNQYDQLRETTSKLHTSISPLSTTASRLNQGNATDSVAALYTASLNSNLLTSENGNNNNKKRKNNKAKTLVVDNDDEKAVDLMNALEEYVDTINFINKSVSEHKKATAKGKHVEHNSNYDRPILMDLVIKRGNLLYSHLVERARAEGIPLMACMCMLISMWRCCHNHFTGADAKTTQSRYEHYISNTDKSDHERPDTEIYTDYNDADLTAIQRSMNNPWPFANNFL